MAQTPQVNPESRTLVDDKLADADSGATLANGTAGFDQYLEIKSLAWPAGA